MAWAVRPPGGQDGLTRKQAEARLRELIAETVAPPHDQSPTFDAAANSHLRRLEEVMQGHNGSGLPDHAAPSPGPVLRKRPASGIAAADIGDYIAAKRRAGLAMKTVPNHLNFAHGVFAFSLRRGWVTINPGAMAARPPASPPDPDIRFLDREGLEALLRAAADDSLASLDRVLWLTAAMTGLRQGELVALRWRDVDWSAR